MDTGPTPAMKQFYEVKHHHPDCIVFFQMGDFFETFGSDAETVSRELDIVLTSRGRDKNGEKMPLAGVPVHSSDSYIARMVARGYRIAVCEQVEDPKKAKGVVKREVTRIITPGTIIDDTMIVSHSTSYLMSLSWDGKKRWGTSFLDISTGEFFITELDDESPYMNILSEISRNNPSECLVGPGIPENLCDLINENGVPVTKYEGYIGDPEAATRSLLEHFGVPTLDAYGCGGAKYGVIAACSALSYAKETQMSTLSHINRLSFRSTGNHMILDSITLRNLEILKNVRNEKIDHDLFSTLNHHTRTPMGRRLLQSTLIRPLTDKEGIDNRLDAVGFFVEDTQARLKTQELLKGCSDIERIAGRISYGNATPRDLVALRNSLGKIPEISSLLEEGTPYLISESLSQIHDFEETTRLISSAIVEDPPANTRGSGIIKSGYSSKLDELRDLAINGKDWIAAFQQEERERTGIKSLKIGFNKVFGYYIEITKTNLHLAPPEYIRKQTMTNAERFTLPKLSEKEALISNAEEKIGALEKELYSDLINILRSTITELQETALGFARLDLFSSFAEIAVYNNYTRPEILESEKTTIREGRHPVVEHNLESGYVPNDIEINSSHEQIMIITGANMAGKSTYMRSIALIHILAQAGSFVPAAHAKIGIADRIFTRVGAFDDLASGQSTFMVEMLELSNILNNFTGKSLIILDEIGRGTSTIDGTGIAQAVLEYLHGGGGKGPRTLFATHFHELIAMEDKLKRVVNYHFAVRETGSDVTFLRKIIRGPTDKSYGIHVAGLAGIPKKVTSRAEEIQKELLVKENMTGGGRTRVYTQMLLVDGGGTPDNISGKERQILNKLQSIDINTMTPVEALNCLNALLNTIDNGGSR